MSSQLINRSSDLLQLRNDGYDIVVVEGYLLVRNVPYVDSNKTLKLGTLISTLDLAGDRTTKPSTHVAYWTGNHPCHADGSKITSIENGSPPKDLAKGVRADFTFSAKAKYSDYHQKMRTYIGRIAGEAAKIDPNATAQKFVPIAEEDDNAIFHYIDTASSRANIVEVNNKVAGLCIGIIGLGGTGSYVLDLVAKSPVKEIHLFDADVFLQHNAFRAPGAPTLEQLYEHPPKTHYLEKLYSSMRRGIFAYEVFLGENNLDLIDNLDFAFLCLDQGNEKWQIVEYLASNEIPFIEVGMGVQFRDGQLQGIVKVVKSTSANRDEAASHISFADGVDLNNEYSTNIQIAELNAFNAAMAVIEWKRYYGVYCDTRSSWYAGYSIASGEIVLDGPE